MAMKGVHARLGLAREHYAKLLTIAANADTERPELRQAKAVVGGR